MSNKYWTEAWEQTKAEYAAKSNVPLSEYRAGGRATKAYPNKEDESWWNENGSGLVENWITWRQGGHNWKIWEVSPGVPAIEIGLTPIWNDIPVQMHIDRVMVNEDGELIVVDLKTGKTNPTSSLQLAFYAAGLETFFGIRPQYGAYWLAREGGIGEMFNLDKYPTDAIIDLVTKFDTARKQGLFMPNFNHCRMCSVVNECEWKK